jgi:outer membrane protein TolC
MDRAGLTDFLPLAALRRRAGALRRRALTWGTAILPLVGTGCAQLLPSVGLSTPPVRVVRASGAEAVEPPANRTPAKLPVTDAPDAHAPPAVPRTLAINLDTVLRLAEDQNAQVALTRAKVREACAESDLAAVSWLPRLEVGTAYYRHEGGTVNPDGTFVHSSYGTFFGGMELTGHLDIQDAVYQRVNAERQLWQQKGELRRITSETLLEAAETYVDLLAARTGEAIAESLQKDLQDLLVRAQKLASTEPGARVEVARIQAQLKGRDQAALELHAQAERAAVKLAYLLGLDPSLTLVAIDPELVPFELVDATIPAADLTARVLSTGPGIREMEGLLALIHQNIERSKGPGRFLPIFEVRMDEGAFGAGPGSESTWDNRWDLNFAARWNLTDAFTRCDRERILQAKTLQAHLAYQDLRAKLTAGVYESREVILSGREQIRTTQDEITEARRAFKLSNERLKSNVPSSSASEVLLSLQALSLAQSSYVNVLRTYDKAQLRLMVLLGPSGNPAAAPGNCPTPPEHGQ